MKQGIATLIRQPFTKTLNIALEAYSPLGGEGANLIEDSRLKTIGAKYNKSAAQVILRWHLQRGVIIFPKSVHKERIISNADIYDFELSSEDMKAISLLNDNHRFGPDPEDFDF